MPRLDRNFRNKQHQCTTQTQMFHDSKVLECLIRILCEKKEYSNLLFWRYCGTRDLGCATWNTFVPIAWIRRRGVLELKLYVVKVYLSDPSGNDLSDFSSPNIFLLFPLCSYLTSKCHEVKSAMSPFNLADLFSLRIWSSFFCKDWGGWAKGSQKNGNCSWLLLLRGGTSWQFRGQV